MSDSAIHDILALLGSLTLSCSVEMSPPIFYRDPTWYDRGGWTWNYTTGSPQGHVDFSDERWLYLLEGWVIEGKTIRHKADDGA